MVDLAIICILSWFAVAGWSRGFQRSLFDSLSFFISLLFLSMVIPFFQDHLLDSGMNFSLFLKQESQISRGMEIPLKIMSSQTVAAFNSAAPLTAANQWMLYEWYMIVLLCAGSLFMGIQMIWQVFRVAETETELTQKNRWMGGLAGVLLGLFLVLYVAKLASPISWAIRVEVIDMTIAHSVILRSLYHIIPW